ncbi:MAG: hypothetical protein KAT68_00605 [Bacteroidales bacterium]|nr:hypothetical protein [Bacteroidales bacterium]
MESNTNKLPFYLINIDKTVAFKVYDNNYIEIVELKSFKNSNLYTYSQQKNVSKIILEKIINSNTIIDELQYELHKHKIVNALLQT